MIDYDFKEIEEKWRKYWDKAALYKTPGNPKRKYYVLEMFAYPSGDIHIGHFRNYTIGDVVARYRMMQGYDVLHPFGWDAFGMPAEQAAIKNNIHPKNWTLGNINTSRETLKKMSISYDWEREVTTCLPDYYKWTQWLFLLLYKRGLAYQAPSLVNWCQTCQTVLANEQAQDGKCWRCKGDVIKKELDRCWFFKYTEYAERLLNDIDKLTNWPENVKIMQKNWIGRSEGCEIDFSIEGRSDRITVFTTRPDTIYGVTFMAIAPEHSLANELIKGSKYEKEVSNYIEKAIAKKEVDRAAIGEKDGVFTGKYAVNPLSGEKVQLWVADYVLASYGTGVVMGVPAHDQRDFLFAKKYDIPIKVVIQPKSAEKLDTQKMSEAYVDAGVMVNSGQFDGLDSDIGIKKIIENCSKKGIGRARVNYKLKDWLISRQRYWGAPIPIIHCKKCGAVPVNEKDLPVLLPDVRGKNLLPKGRSPLADVSEYIKTKCPKCGGNAERDTDTMDTFMCSSFYLFRYADPHNTEKPWRLEEIRKWLPVDIYIGGVEHACMHLLYFRFITKVLYDAGWLNFDEPVNRLYNHGMVLDEEGRIMSKSLGNVVSPADIMEKWGVDVCRIAMLFFAPSDWEIRWSERGLIGAHRFIQRFWATVYELKDIAGTVKQSAPVNQRALSGNIRNIRRKLHQTIEKTTIAMDGTLHFNTAIASIMELLNVIKDNSPLEPKNNDEKFAIKEVAEGLVLLMAPMAPFIAEEFWEAIGNKSSIFKHSWPKYDAEIAKAEEVEIIIQINGKVRDRLLVGSDLGEELIKQKALEQERVKSILSGKLPRKVIVIPNKLVNIVV